MDGIKHFLRLGDYESWANLRILAMLESSQPPPQEALHLYGHILNAQKIWLARIRGEKPVFSSFAERSLEDCKRLMSELLAEWETFFTALTAFQLEEKFSYQNLQGIPQESILSDVLTHVFNHSTYHRGQIVKHLKSTGMEILPTDFILFTREKK